MDGLSREIECIRGLLASVRNGIDSLAVTPEVKALVIVQLDSIPPTLRRLETNCREGAGVAQERKHGERVAELEWQLRTARNANRALSDMAEAARPLFEYLATPSLHEDDD